MSLSFPSHKVTRELREGTYLGWQPVDARPDDGRGRPSGRRNRERVWWHERERARHAERGEGPLGSKLPEPHGLAMSERSVVATRGRPKTPVL